MITLRDSDVDTLSSMSQQAAAGIVGYWQIYQWLADTLQQSYGAPNIDQTVEWLRGATEANASRGSMAMLIGEYTRSQQELRYGTAASDANMQDTDNGTPRDEHVRSQRRRSRLQQANRTFLREAA